MCHSHYDLVDAGGPASLKDRIEREHERLTAFERKALLTHKFRMDEGLESFRLIKFTKDIAVHLGKLTGSASTALNAIGHPFAHGRILYVSEFHAEGFTIGLPKPSDHLLERHLTALLEVSRRHCLVQIGIPQSKFRRLQTGKQRRGFRQRIQMCGGVPDRAISFHQQIHTGLEWR